MRLKNGYFLVHRKIFECPILRNPENFMAWLTIISNVNYSEIEIEVMDKIIKIKRGQSLRSLESWAKLIGMGWDKSKVRRFFCKLEKEKMIKLELINTYKKDKIPAQKSERKSERKSTRLTVCNYDTYQDLRTKIDTQKDTDVKNKINISFDLYFNSGLIKTRKDKCEEKWNKLKDIDRENIMTHIPKYLKTNDLKFLKRTESYLNGRVWEDEIHIEKETQLTEEEERINEQIRKEEASMYGTA